MESQESARFNMITFTTIASGSSGNAYLLEAQGGPPLLLEAGIPIKKLRQKLQFGIMELAGCLISHEHGDHAKAVRDLLKMGIDCFMSEGTAKALGIENHHRTWILPGRVGDWTIQTFPLKHDAAEPTGFLVASVKDLGDQFLFIPDTAYVTNRFKKVTQIAVECNYIVEILSANIIKGSLQPVVGHRTRRNHMSLETLISMLKANDLSVCRAIHLIHLSNGNSDEARMIKEVQEETGIPTYAA